MKKFLKIMAVIVLSLLIFFVVTFKYRQYKANVVSIPKNATSLVKISVDEIYKSVAANMISNLSFYLKSDGINKINKNSKFDLGLKIPASIYLYTIADKPKTALFSKLAINDFQEFSNFLKNNLKLNITKTSGLNLATNNLKNFTILFNEEYAAIAFSTQIDEFEPILIDILNEKDFIKVGDSRFNTLKSATNHIAYAAKELTGSVDFEDGAINFIHEFSSKGIVQTTTPAQMPFNETSAIKFYINADFKADNDKTLKLKNFNLQRDSLLKYYRGRLDFEWINSTQQTDSVITYEYNDDFEKVEKVTMQKRDVPNILLSIDADANGLKKYLSQQNIINTDSGLVNKAIFPLYKVFIGGDDKQLVFATKKPEPVNNKKIATDNFASLMVDFIKLNKQNNIPIFSNYTKNLTQLNANGKFTGNDKIKVDGKLELVNKNINALYQLLKNF
ncbi:hypothetical protein [Pedobacter mendelii]|uniref:DUF4836 family protein n=1 Tax=Pedobacter mendelii TaxID=1908240 RepID=A0ABQ2BI54_9SPHI|nr:hypothetical protein [Pedobacter mendelii]GGI23984.1 hypothetical protein GCM10008119_10390 [Pedobacter mendelii]